MTTNCIRCEILDAHTACVTLERPHAHNAYTIAMMSEFHCVVTELERNADIRCVILTGSGDRAFCAGADLFEAQRDSSDSARRFVSPTGGYQPLQYLETEKIWIAAVQGYALGGGFELALHCDFIIAANTAVFGLPEVGHGILPLGGGMTHLKHALPLPLLKEIVLLGRRLSAAEAYERGIINHICKPEQLHDTAYDIAKRLCALDNNTVVAARDLLHSMDKLSDVQWRQLSESYVAENISRQTK